MCKGGLTDDWVLRKGEIACKVYQATRLVCYSSET